MEAYKIAVHLAMTSNAPAFLSTLSSQLLGVHSRVKDLEGGFNRLRAAIAGAAGVYLGKELIEGVGKIAQHGKDLLDQQDKLIRRGRTHLEVANLTADAYKRITKEVPTAAASDILKSINELTSVLGNSKHAEAAAPYALKLEALLGNATGKSAAGEGYNFWRAVEERGGTQLPEEERNKLMGIMYAGSAAFGGKVGGADWFHFAKRAGTSWMNMDPEMMKVVPTLIQSLGADTAGTAYMSATQSVLGAATLSKQQVLMMKQLGLLDMSKVQNDHGRWRVGLGGVHGSLEHGNNLYDWAQKVLKPALQAAGMYDDPKLRQAAEAKLFPNRNSQRMIESLINPLTVAQIEKDKALQGPTLSIDKGYDNFINNNPKGVEAAYEAQKKSMLEAIGAPIMQAAIPVMKSVTDMFNKVGEFASAHPEAIKNIGVGIAALGAAFMTAGVVALVAAIGAGGWLIAGIIGIGAAVAGLAAINWDSIVAGIGKIVAAIKSILTGSLNLGAGAAHPQGGMGSDGAPLIPLPRGPAGKQGYYSPTGLKYGMNDNHTVIMTVDGEVLGRATTRRQVMAAQFPNAIGGVDTYGSWTSPGTGLIDAA